MQRAYDTACRGAAAMGRDLLAARNYKAWLQEVGCKSRFSGLPDNKADTKRGCLLTCWALVVDVEERVFMMPINPWPDHPQLRLVGSYWLRNTMDGIHGVGYKMFRAAGLSGTDIENLVQETKHQLPHRNNRSYTP